MNNWLCCSAVCLMASATSFGQGGTPVFWPVGEPSAQDQTRSLFNTFGDFHGVWQDCGLEYNFHNGVDILPEISPYGTDVIAARKGDISHIYHSSVTDEYLVVIVDYLGISTHGWAYGHLTDPSINGWSEGDPIEVGELIAQMNPDTENQHLHFSWSEARWNSSLTPPTNQSFTQLVSPV